MLKTLDLGPIALVKAEDKGNGQNASSKDTMNLNASCYLVVGASVMNRNKQH